MRLVDMDGFFMPAMTKAPGEIGHPHFQHPRRTAAHWGADADAFSLLVIYEPCWRSPTILSFGASTPEKI